MNTTVKTVVLPATRREVPASLAEFSVSSLKQMQGMDGVVVNANVRHASRKGVVGMILNDGFGGGTKFRGNDREVQQEWDAAMTDSGPFAATETYDYEDSDGNRFSGTFHESLALEIAPEWLVSEYEQAKALNRYFKKGETPVQTKSQRAEGGVEFFRYRTKDVAKITAAQVAAKEAQFSYWTADGWVEVNADFLTP